MKLLQQYLLPWNISLNPRQEAQFELYYEMLIQKNQVMNLTAITEKAEVQERHFLDSLAISQAIKLTGTESLIDLGTGAGFPGIPLKILYPELNIVLADALQKRVGFLNEVITKLELSKITAIHARAEDLGHDDSYRERFDLCVSRAVASLNLLAEYCLPFVRIGGIFAAYKSVSADQEMQEAAQALQILGGGNVRISKQIIGPSQLSRSLILVEKSSGTPLKYPRAKAQKKPL